MQHREAVSPLARMIAAMIAAIVPLDDLEREHQASVLEWICSGAPIFRVAKPNIPPRHLVSYFLVVDFDTRSVLLVDHRKSGLLLPAGGHVEPGEHPTDAARREMLEELNQAPVFTEAIGDRPLFVASTMTVAVADHRHTDVSLWYVVAGTRGEEFDYDAREFSAVRWLGFDEVLATDIALLDPHLHRFIAKLETLVLA